MPNSLCSKYSENEVSRPISEIHGNKNYGVRSLIFNLGIKIKDLTPGYTEILRILQPAFEKQ